MPKAATKPTFSVADANRTLPLVRSITEDIVREFARLKELGRDRRAVEASAPPRHDAEARAAQRAQLDALKAEIDEGAARVDAFINELVDLGAELRDPERGQVDFPSERNGRAVWLCWRLEDESVLYWRGMDETSSERRPIEGTKRGRAADGPAA